MHRLIVFLLAGYVLFSVHTLSAAESYLGNCAMYADTTFTNELYQFTPFDKIYIVYDFINVPPGQYNLSVDWITPFGSLERQTTHTFTVDKTVPSYRVYFWLKLVKRGLIKRTLTGQYYKEEFYGEWKVNYYLNGVNIGWKTFQVL